LIESRENIAIATLFGEAGSVASCREDAQLAPALLSHHFIHLFVGV